MNKTFVSAVRSPWVLTTIPIILGGMWLILHPEIITNNLDKPYMLLAGPALVGSILTGWLVIKFFNTIGKGCKSAWEALVRAQKEDSSAQFFWITIVVFMVVSVFASGNFFTNLEHDVIPGLGYITALFIDFVAVQAMKARLNAVRMRDNRGQILYLFGVLLCSGASAWANVYTSLAEFNQHQTGALPIWMLNVAPWFGLVFPALILLLSITADYTLDQTSTKLNPDNYRTQEEKRLALIEIQREMLQRRLQVEQEIDQLTGQMKSKKSGRTFFLIAWLFPHDPLSMQAVVTTATEEIKKVYDAQFATLSEQISNQIRQLGEQATQSTLQFQQETQSTLSELQLDHQTVASRQVSTSEQFSDLAKQIEQIIESNGHFQDEIQSQLRGIQTDHQTTANQQTLTGKQLFELTKQIEQVTKSNGHLKDEIQSTLTTTVSEQIATMLQSYNLPDEAMITELIESAIRQYTECETDEHNVPIEGEKPLYPFYTAELKEVVARFPAIDSWIRAGRRTISLQDVVAATNLTSQFVSRQANDGLFTKTQTKNVYTTKSVINWLKTDPSPKRKATKREEQNTEEIEAISQHDDSQDTEQIATVTEIQNGHSDKTTVDLKEYAELLV